MESKFNLKILLLLSTGHCVVDIYQGALPAVLPFLKDELGLTYTVAGIILIMANITSSILQPVFGFLSTKRRRPFSCQPASWLLVSALHCSVFHRVSFPCFCL